jgi:hypothetical protein
MKQGRLRRVGAAAVVSALLVTCGCSGNAPAKTFSVAPGATQVFALHDQEESTVSRTVRLRAPTSRWNLRIDCVGRGDLTIVISDQGSGSAPCHLDGEESSGYIGISTSEEAAVEEFGVTIHAPRHTRWSAAVDVRLLF